MKSEPDVWSIDQQKKAGIKGAPWDGVRNYQAAKNLNALKIDEKTIIGYGAPAKATTALNFFGISKEIDYIIEDNKLKHKKFVPGVKIPIYSKDKLLKKNPLILVLAWNFFNEIKKNNSKLSNNFINIKDLEK